MNGYAFRSLQKLSCVLFVLFSSQLQAVNVPITLDHNRILIDVYLSGTNGSTERVVGWVDTGNPDLWLSERVAEMLGLQYSGPLQPSGFGDIKIRKATAPTEIKIGEMKLALTGIKESLVFIGSTIGPGLKAEINLPSSLLRNYDVIIDFPGRELTLSKPHTLKFKGKISSIFVNDKNGLIQVPATIAGENCSLGLDVGATISFLSSEIFNKLSASNSGWPQMLGAIGAANIWGLTDEPQWNLMRIPVFQCGTTTLTHIAFASLNPEIMKWITERAGTQTVGLIGSNALLNQRIAISYAKKEIYFEPVSTFDAFDMDLIGLVLRPEPGGDYTIIGVSYYDGQLSVPEARPGDSLIEIDGIPVKGFSMGKVWSMLGGKPGDKHTLRLRRGSEMIRVQAHVQRFLNTAVP